MNTTSHVLLGIQARVVLCVCGLAMISSFNEFIRPPSCVTKGDGEMGEIYAHQDVVELSERKNRIVQTNIINLITVRSFEFNSR